MAEATNYPRQRVALISLIFPMAILLTIVNITTPATHIPIFHVYTTKSIPEQDNQWTDFGLYGFCYWDGSQNYNCTRQFGYNPAPVLANSMYSPTTLFNDAEASHLTALSRGLVVHLVACGCAWAALVSAVLVSKIGNIPQLAATLLTFVFTLVGFALDSALFIPLQKAILPHSYGAPLHGYWIVLVALIWSAVTLAHSILAFVLERRYKRDMVSYREISKGMAADIHMEPTRAAYYDNPAAATA